MVPMRGCSRGSTTSVREVPSASGWPGQSAADAACAVTQVSMPRTPKAATAQSSHDTLAIMTRLNRITDHRTTPVCHSRTCSRSNHYTRRHECRLNRLNSTHYFGFNGRRPAGRLAAGRNHMDHAVVVVPQIAQESRQHGRGLRLGIVQQDDALAGGLEPLGEQLQFLPAASSDSSRWPRDRRRTPTMPRYCSRSSVAGVDLEAGKAEERRARGRGRGAVKRRLHRRDALVDLAHRPRPASCI